ncbi:MULTISPECIES: hypothetical protein [Crateriforma]|uniref:hypothetical protein n=1 Tax=Crateriforma TaxID=2714592 RepID=UPI0014467DEC|nr:MULTISPECIES: hypothetical protein [Crateriforma]
MIVSSLNHIGDSVDAGGSRHSRGPVVRVDMGRIVQARDKSGHGDRKTVFVTPEVCSWPARSNGFARSNGIAQSSGFALSPGRISTAISAHFASRDADDTGKPG